MQYFANKHDQMRYPGGGLLTQKLYDLARMALYI